MVRERATENGVQVTLEGEGDVDIVTGDERRIRQVIFNLLSNAVKFTPADGAVDVRSSQENGEVRVSVADTDPASPPRTRSGSSRSSSRPRSGSGSARGPVSAWHFRSG